MTLSKRGSQQISSIHCTELAFLISKGAYRIAVHKILENLAQKLDEVHLFVLRQDTVRKPTIFSLEFLPQNCVVDVLLV